MNLSINYASILALLTVAFSLCACSDSDSYDVEGNTGNIVFINSQEWTPVGISNGFLFNTILTPVGSFLVDADKAEAQFTVQCTHAAETDIVVAFEADPLLIAGDFEAFPSGVTLKMDKSELTIPKGATIADGSITLSISADEISVFNVGAYMASVRIVSTSAATFSSNYNSASFLVKKTYTNCLNNATEITGSVADRTGWTATGNDSNLEERLFDDSSRTYYYVTSFPFTLEFDLGSVHSDITGFAMGFYSGNYGMGQADIYTSETGTDNYESQGSASFLQGATQYLNFYKNVKARFIKIEVTSPYSTSYGTAIAEFNVYQKD